MILTKSYLNNIKDNTICEIDAKKDLDELNEIKNAEIIKYKKCIPGHKKLLNLFNNLSHIILTDKILESESQENENENEKIGSRKKENEDEDYENQNESENKDDDYKNENDDDVDETMSQNEKIKHLNDNLDEIIGKSKSFEVQIKSLEKKKI